ncbi:MAG: hypothetical protein J1F60_00855 [Oscillospiraceae bacterium]|nr:hypothetical protein [Oscillospiraceae bacterium]
MANFEQLRAQHKEFIYEGYEINEDSFVFHFRIDDYIFAPCWQFSSELIQNAADKELLNYAVFSLGMAELVSYWKCACPPVVRVNCGSLDNEQINWWKKLYFNGLGEFFYRNGIKTDIESFMQIIPCSDKVPHFPAAYSGEGFMIPVGGGKDSVVTLELLSEYHDINSCFIINPRGATLGCAHTAGYDDSQIIGVRRTIDKQLLELNKQGYLNGHTPLSSVIAFSSWIFAYCGNRKYIALSNESSANESNVSGTKINHQYSKSTEFEADFRNYTSKYFGGYPEYFSMLRPWSEWQIAKKFVQYPKYFPVFQSCNLGSKTDTWCSNCAKCLYVYIMLSAFLTDEQLIKIFGKNMLEGEEYQELFNGLVYQDYDKPFECVGTKNEINLALYNAAKRRESSGSLPLLLKRYIERKDKNDKPEELDTFFDDNNFVPGEFLSLLKL